MKMRTLPICLGCLCALALAAVAADWPHWRGPDRDDVSRETGLLKSWPEGGPALLWTCTDAGIGYSGPAVVGDRLFTMGARDEEEFVLAFDVNSGKQVWATKVGSLLTNGWGDGPRGTPAVGGALLYAMSGLGNLVCVETATGKERWRFSMVDDFGGRVPGWGYCESPLVDGTKVLCTPGGAQGSIVALDKMTGKLLWQSEKVTDGAAYSSINIATIGTVRQYVQQTAARDVGVAAHDGRLLWEASPAINSTAVIPSPLVHDNFVFVTSGYPSRGGAGALLKLTPDGNGTKAEEVYVEKSLSNHHGGMVLVGDYLYGYSESPRGRWVCAEFKTGKIAWESTKLGKGSLIGADGRLYLFSEDGKVVLLEANPDSWKEAGRFTLPKETSVDRKSGQIWTHPVVANGRLYLRDQDLIFCFDVKDRSARLSR